jgi:phosphoadenosine phosphosulfate reductase
MNAIQISGGVDSLAMLWLLRPIWNDSVVMFCDSGAAYPGTRDLMRRIADMVPRFRTVYSNQPEVLARSGFPVDVVPVKFSQHGEAIFGPQPIKFQSYFDCCRQVLWEPMHRACVVMGIDTIYRGQRKDDVRRAGIHSGHVDPFGIRIVFPIHEWTRAQAFEYVREHCAEWLPAYYETEKTSRDCWDCTAYRDDNIERVQALPDEQRAIVEGRLGAWRAAVLEELNQGA